MNGEQISSQKSLPDHQVICVIFSHNQNVEWWDKVSRPERVQFSSSGFDLHLAEFLLQRLKPQNCSCFAPFFLQTSQDGHGEVSNCTQWQPDEWSIHFVWMILLSTCYMCTFPSIFFRSVRNIWYDCFMIHIQLTSWCLYRSVKWTCMPTLHVL